MARDQVELMAALGLDRFAVVGHDRGGRVAHRMALDHPAAVERAGRARHRPHRHDVRPDGQGVRHPLFLVVLPDPALPAARAADRRRSRIFPAHAYRRPDQDAGRGRPGDLRGISALLPRSRPRAMRSARTTGLPPPSTWSTTPPTPTARSRRLCWRCGARRAWSAPSTTCWRPGARRPSMSGAGRWIAGTACRRSCPKRPRPSCWPS